MQVVRYSTRGLPQRGARRDDGIVPLDGLREEVEYGQLTSPSFLRTVTEAVEAVSDGIAPESEVKLLAPGPRPGKIVCVGLNYHDHADEQDEEVPDRPVLLGKAATAVTNPGDPIVRPTGIEELDYEVELGVVIGRTAKQVDAGDARKYVAGYTVLDDVSARDAQFEDGQFFRGRSYDTFAPMGPTLVSDSRPDPSSLNITCRVTGETKQSSNTSEFIFGVEKLIEYISGVTTFRPGDVISTGTPGGVGIFRDLPELLDPGDTVEVAVEGVGTLANHVTEAAG